MTKQLTILGSGSAMPTFSTNPSGQILEMCEKCFLIDVGEGVQNTIRQMGLHTSRLYTIFISHLHGDHCFGLMGLLSTLGMMGRTQDMHIFAHKDLEKLIQPWLQYFCKDLPYAVIFHAINPRRHEVIWEDRTLTVSTVPLRHTVPCCGFLFEEKRRRRHEETGEQPFRYAYLSDTGYKPAVVPYIQGVDVLYHEATYTEEKKDSAERFQHSTALQAAKIAQKAGAKKLILGHFSARYTSHEAFLTEAQTVFPNVLLAEDKKVFTL